MNPFPGEARDLELDQGASGSVSMLSEIRTGRHGRLAEQFRLLLRRRRVLTRFDGYWGRKPDHDRVAMKILTNNGARTAALLSGAVDVIKRPPLENLDRLKADARLTIAESPSANIIYMSFDQALEPRPRSRHGREEPAEGRAGAAGDLDGD